MRWCLVSRLSNDGLDMRFRGIRKHISVATGVGFFVTTLLGFAVAEAKSGEGALPKGFAYLRDIDARILQEMRYYGPHNFLGRRVKGYEAGECILTIRAARALRTVQDRLVVKGLSLKVYDCYRPKRAVADFVEWAGRVGDETAKAEFYPTLEKSRLFGLGYIAKRSSHSRGSTVDLTIVELPPKAQPQFNLDEQLACYLPQAERFADNSLDFGTGYDCFHERSHLKSSLIGAVAKRNRALLAGEMARAGFESYSKEWWHYSFKDEPYKRTGFDFPIVAYEASEKGDVGEDGEGAEKSEAERKLMAVKGRLRVVCVASDDVLNVRSVPEASGELIAAIPFDGNSIVSQGCDGEVSLEEWRSLKPAQRRERGLSVPWCKISSFNLAGGGEPIEADGWVSGLYVAEEGDEAPICK